MLELPPNLLALKAAPEPNHRSLQMTHYEVQDNCIFRVKNTSNGTVLEKLSNFVARVVEDIVFDDGAETRRQFVIEGVREDGHALPRVIVLASEFGSMGWIHRLWGFGLSVSPGQGARDYLRHAIEQLSPPDLVRRTVYGHTGWREIGGHWCFLHGSGAIKASGTVEGVEVDLQTGLEPYSLPPAPSPAETRDLIQLVIRAAEMGSPKAILPLLAAVFRAPLNQWAPCPTVVWVCGETGTRKTTTTALLLSIFGGPFGTEAPPASWTDTENALERKAFVVKDLPLLVDDFTPEQSSVSAVELERRASRFIRAVGNGKGRGRLRSDCTARPEYPPRCSVISTAERLPPVGMSALARIFPVPFDHSSVDLGRLTVLQRNADQLPKVGAAFVKWLADQADAGALSKGELKQQFETLRSRARSEGHPRLAESVAHLASGMDWFCRFAIAHDGISPSEAAQLTDQVWSVLEELAAIHAAGMAEEDPAAMFLTAVQEGLASGECHLEAHKVDPGVGSRQGIMLGWVDNRWAYLLPQRAIQYAADRLRMRGGLPIGDRALFALLVQRGVVKPGSQGKSTTVIRTPNGSSRVLQMHRAAVLPQPV